MSRYTSALTFSIDTCFHACRCSTEPAVPFTKPLSHNARPCAVPSWHASLTLHPYLPPCLRCTTATQALGPSKSSDARTSTHRSKGENLWAYTAHASPLQIATNESSTTDCTALGNSMATVKTFSSITITDMEHGPKRCQVLSRCRKSIIFK